MSTNKFCSKCGTEITGTGKFCKTCGEKLSSESISAADILQKSADVYSKVSSTVSKVESTINAAEKIKSAAEQVSQIASLPPGEWKVYVGEQLPVAGQILADSAISAAKNKVQQKVTEEVVKQVKEKVITPRMTTGQSELFCPSCKSPLKTDSIFCKTCGAKVEGLSSQAAPSPVCPSCHAPLKPGARFCKNCGEKR